MAIAEEIHLDDIGTVFEVTLQEDDLALDVSTATEKLLLFATPAGVLKQKIAAFKTDGTDGIIQYTTIAGDLDEIGKWKVQARVTLPGGTWSSSTESFKVYGNLD